MKKTFITSPIYYVNDIPHIGHAYTTIACDVFKKYKKLKGENVFFLTGTDEHGQKIENSAKDKNKNPQDYANEVSSKFRDLWDYLNIDYDYFVRTTDTYHDIGVKKAFEIMQKKGDIYKGYYEGNYCVSCETFFTKRQLIDGIKCPDCGKITKELKEESYFFALSKYESRLLSWYEENPNVILPLFKKNEVINFIKNGLSDLSITRSTFKWGISLPKSANDEAHIIYVWLDALLSYITPLGFGNDRENKMDLFNNAYHFVGKDILRFHAIFWPIFLMSLDLPLPKRIFTHGWWTINGAKMSKSVGNVINPKLVAETYGIEVLRYFLLREVPFGQDGDFSYNALCERANAELSDSLGNLLNRLLGMSEKYFSLTVESSDFSSFESEMESIRLILNPLDDLMENMTPNRYLEEVWRLFDLANGMITKYAPWALIKQNEYKKVESLLVFIANILAKGTLLIYPILPKSAEMLAKSLGLTLDFKNDFEVAKNYENLIAKNAMINRFTLTKIPPLFPKIELDSSADSSNLKNIKSEKGEIKIDDFHKIDIRTGKILSAECVANSEKLLLFQIDFGAFGTRQIISGIAKFYTPSELVGKKICAIINLKPTKIMGIKSEGMLLTSEDSNDGGVKLLFVNASEGSKVC